MKTTFLILLATLASVPLLARPWTNSQGKSIEADFVDLKNDVVILKDPRGRIFQVPIGSLSEADQSFARSEGVGKAPATESSESTAPASVYRPLLEGKLVALEGKRVGKYEMAEEPQYYAFYFSASWCGPCRQFTPKLISFYKENPNAKKTFEVIFMSRDNSEGDMEDYMKKDEMPWPAVRYRDADRIDEINKLRGRGIPCLVLVDREGKVVADSYVNGEYRGPLSVMSKMAELSQSSASR